MVALKSLLPIAPLNSSSMAVTTLTWTKTVVLLFQGPVGQRIVLLCFREIKIVVKSYSDGRILIYDCAASTTTMVVSSSNLSSRMLPFAGFGMGIGIGLGCGTGIGFGIGGKGTYFNHNLFYYK